MTRDAGRGRLRRAPDGESCGTSCGAVLRDRNETVLTGAMGVFVLRGTGRGTGCLGVARCVAVTDPSYKTMDTFTWGNVPCGKIRFAHRFFGLDRSKVPRMATCLHKLLTFVGFHTIHYLWRAMAPGDSGFSYHAWYTGIPINDTTSSTSRRGHFEGSALENVGHEMGLSVLTCNSQ